MRAPETLALEQGIRVADEIAIGEEEQSHDVERHGCHRIAWGIYVSSVDIVFGGCHCDSIASPSKTYPKAVPVCQGRGFSSKIADGVR
jgi:hypothetical protein